VNAVINQLQPKISVDQIGEIIESEALVLLKHMPECEGIDLKKATSDQGTVILYQDNAVGTENGGRIFAPTWFANNIALNLASNNEAMGKPSCTIESVRVDGCTPTI
jgi:hypothetical protein